MTSTFNQNRVFEENLEANFIIDSGIFTINGQQYIVTHFLPLMSVQQLTEWTHVVLDTDTNNYFIVDYRWSFDTVNWTNWITMDSTFSAFPNPNVNQKTWLQIRYSFVTNGSKQSTLSEITIKGIRKIDPIFEPVILQPGIPVAFTNQDTYKVFKITGFQAFVANNIPLTGVDLQFRYTQTQGRSWSQWFKLTEPVLQSIKFDPIRFCNFQFGFINNNQNPISLYDLELIGEFQNITGNYAKINRLGLKSQCNPITQPITGQCDPNCPDGYIDQFGNVAGTCTSCCTSCSDSVTPWSLNPTCGDGCSTDNLFKVNDRKSYGQLPQLKEYMDSIMNIRNGWEVEYALSDPDQKGSDSILHEHQLFNIIMVKKLNIIVPKNQFPNNEISFSGLDLDLIQSFEVHITKQEFKDTFGVEFRPGKEDYLYFCDRNQLWEVDQLVPARGAYNTETYYRVLLKKYNKRANRQHTNPQDQAWHDALTKHSTLEDLFKIQVDAEIKHVSKNNNINIESPSQQYSHTTVIDFRGKIDNRVQFKSELISNATITLTDTQYDMPLTSKNAKLVKYTYKDQELTKSDNRALSMWFRMDDYDPAWTWDLFNNYDNINSKGYKLTLGQGALTFTFNGNIWQLPVTNIVKQTWYCFYVGLNQQQQELEIAVYRRQGENGFALADSKLISVHKNVWQNIVVDDFVHTNEMFIGGVDLMTNNTGGNSKRWNLTNIRLYNQIIEKAKRNIVLNERVVKDAQLTLLIDNAEPKKILPEYGNF